MAGKDNLAPPIQSGAKARELGHIGGIASGIARKEKRILRDALLKKLNARTVDEIINGAIERAKTTDNGFVTLRDTIGEKPVDRQEVETTAPQIVVASKQDMAAVADILAKK